MKQHMPKKEQRRRWLGGWFGGRGETEIAAATVDTKVGDKCCGNVFIFVKQILKQ